MNDLIIDRKYAYLTLRYNWTEQVRGYAQAYVDGRNRLIHRVIMALELGRKLLRKEEVDHRNHNKLDNRVENLRLTNRLGNVQHRKPDPYRGTTFNGYRWVAQVGYKGTKLNLGTFLSREVAAEVAAKKRKELNFLS